jgi:hypothetical protein
VVTPLRKVNHQLGVRGLEVGRDRRDLAVVDGHVADGVEAVLGVDDVAALDEDLVRLGLGGGGGEREEEPAEEAHVRRPYFGFRRRG